MEFMALSLFAGRTTSVLHNGQKTLKEMEIQQLKRKSSSGLKKLIH